MSHSKTKKPVLAIASLTCCEGCQVELLNLNEKLIKIFDIFTLGNFTWVEEIRERPHYDITLVEGSPISKEDFKYLKELRHKSDKIIALGTCAHLGGIQEIKNYHTDSKDKLASEVYTSPEKINNPNIVPIGQVVKIEGIIPTCPIDREEALKLILELGNGLDPEISPHPICHECQWKGYDCILQKGEPCLGPITLGGCRAICLKSAKNCYGCRGPIPGVDTSKHLYLLEKLIGRKQLFHILETFGARNSFLMQANTFK